MRVASIDFLTTGQDFAHRGLFAAGSSVEENSLAAVQAAIDHGFGIEIDVHMTSDEQIVVFHDSTLERMTGAPGNIADRSFARLSTLTLGQSDNGIPRLLDVLDLVAGKVPVLVEVKTSNAANLARLCSCLRRAVEGYQGDLAIISNTAFVLEWFKEHFPFFVRGLVLRPSNFKALFSGVRINKMIQQTGPDVLVVEKDFVQHSALAKWRLQGAPLFAWTITTTQQRDMLDDRVNAFIFEDPQLCLSTHGS